MKKKINITIQVTYEMTKECEVDSDVLVSLENIQKHCPFHVNASLANLDPDVREGYKWLLDNCDENKCAWWDAEIQDLTEEE